MGDKYTLASIAWRKRQRNHRLLFGTPERLVRLNWQQRLAAFSPGQIFGYERWRANKYGTIEWQIFVLQAATNNRPVSRIPGIFPAATLLVSAHGKPNAKRMLAIFDELAASGKLEDLPAKFWLGFNTLFDVFPAPHHLIEKEPSHAKI